MSLTEVYEVPCATCGGELVRVHAEAGEKVEMGRPPRCPDCHGSLGMAVALLMNNGRL